MIHILIFVEKSSKKSTLSKYYSQLISTLLAMDKTNLIFTYNRGKIFFVNSHKYIFFMLFSGSWKKCVIIRSAFLEKSVLLKLWFSRNVFFLFLLTTYNLSQRVYLFIFFKKAILLHRNSLMGLLFYPSQYCGCNLFYPVFFIKLSF